MMGKRDSRYEEHRLSHAIDKEIEKDRIHKSKEIRLLLLGAGESGKSTFMKQAKVILDKGYNADELASFTFAVMDHVHSVMLSLVAAVEQHGIQYSNSDMEKHIATVRVQQLEPSDLLIAAKALWRDAGAPLQIALKLARTFQISDSAEYFLSRLDVLSTKGYVPSLEDILRLRVRTTGINEETFLVKKVPFRIIDVGGQKTERRKWLHHFDNVKTVIFFVALSEFDQVLREDNETNRLVDSLNLFESTVMNPVFKNTSFIVFLNKIDLFDAKIREGELPLEHFFPDYNGGRCSDAAGHYLQDLFKARAKKAPQRVYYHFTCATDTSNISVVLNDVTKIVFTNHLKQVGLL